METIIDRQQYHHPHQHHRSWEDTTLEESIELKEPLKPQPVWPNDSPSVVLDLDSNTDTEEDEDDDDDDEEEESDQNDSSEPGYESGEYENSGGNNWEIEMLAAQIRERRSASLDHNINRPLNSTRKRFSRAGSMDHKNE